MEFIVRYARRFRFAVAGLLYAFANDFSFRWQVVLIGLALAAVGYVAQPLSQLELLGLLLAYGLVLITELQNSALEEALDHLHPELHDRIGRTKDMAAGSVLLAGFIAVAIVALVLLW
jgi:diacylglycerol kinase